MSTHKKEVFALVAWIVTSLATLLTFYIAFLVDLVQRWGQPLMLEWHTATLVWLVALVLHRISLGALKAMTND